MSDAMDYNGVYRRRIEEAVDIGKRLGRHVVHDERSKQYPADMSSTLRTVRHPRYGQVLDQGPIGSCTFNAMAGVLMTEPFSNGSKVYDEAFARMGYAYETRVDPYAGYWPPTDTGSSGLAACKAAKNVGLISAYTHTFSLDSFLKALVLKPGLMGINWYSSFDNPGPDGMLEISAGAVVRGGHEMEACYINVEEEWIAGPNSWGPQWGPLRGWYRMRWSTLEDLLAEEGDGTFPVPL